ncbi:hypothetical protein AVEN_110249-1 [Araneus ventricosus]|uniref:Uncharacterized protein n=1 Tax=Araneus ventricosus TaxID=182803 RepID=A0A4Y2TA71_ARAVE|nr:hypothetical protein AVEN_110249-1 [Araneus ventricosus]
MFAPGPAFNRTGPGCRRNPLGSNALPVWRGSLERGCWLKCRSCYLTMVRNFLVCTIIPGDGGLFEKSGRKSTRGLFWDGPRNFEPWSDDEDDTWAGTPTPNFHATPAGGRLATTYYLACKQAPYTADLQWNRVSNLEPSGPKAETLPLGHRGLFLDNLEARYIDQLI